MIEYLKPARKFMASQNQQTAGRIRDAILKLPEGDVKRMQGMGGVPKFRLRVGDFRVIFRVDGYVITILTIDNRGDVYKK